MDTSKNEQAEYQYKQKVLITTGFYKNYKGIIDGFNPKDKSYNIILEIGDRKIITVVKESEIKAVKGLFE